MAKAPDARESKASVRSTVKAAKAAERERKRNSDNPADMGRMRQIAVAYQRTREYDKALPYLLIGSFLLPVVVGVVVGILISGLLSSIILGVAIGVLLAMLMLVRRTKAATYKRYAGQAGS